MGATREELVQSSVFPGIGQVDIIIFDNFVFQLKMNKMYRFTVTMVAVFLMHGAMAQTPQAFELYKSNGKEAKYEKMIKEMAEADVVLFGELHNNSMCHWMQLQVTKSLYAVDSQLIMGAEMFESDNQLIMDEYFNDRIKQSNFEKEMRMWDNYSTDYKPLVEFAKANGLRFVATNVPRRYAALVNKEGLEGLETLSEEARKYLPALPIPFDTLAPNYQEMMNMSMGGHGMGGNMLNMVKAQAIKDAAMAHFILQNLEQGKTMIHFQGDFHSKSYGAIYWYLNQYRPGLKIVTLSTQEAGDLEFKEAYEKVADYILVIPEDMTKTY